LRNRQKGEATIISHREYVGEVTSGTYEGSSESTAFTLSSHRLNPSNAEIFPWLSAFAGAYQEWELTGCLIQLRTESSDIAPAVTLGMFGMAAEYNVLTPAPNSKLEVENMENAGTCKISCDLIMPIECARSQTPVSHLYVGPTPGATGDLRLYDHCKFYVFSSGIPKENVKIAELWITYEIAFYKPTITPLLHSQIGYSWYGRFMGCSNDLLLGTSVKEATTNTTLISWDGTWFNFPKQDGQCYLVSINWYPDSSATLDLYLGDPISPILSGMEIAYMYGDPYSPHVPDFAETSYSPTPHFHDTSTVWQSGLQFVVKLHNTEPVVSPWVPRLKLEGGTTSLPTLPSDSTMDANVTITLFNREFFVEEEGAWKTPFPTEDAPSEKRLRRRPAESRPIRPVESSSEEEDGWASVPSSYQEMPENPERRAKARLIEMAMEMCIDPMKLAAFMGSLEDEDAPQKKGSRPSSIPGYYGEIGKEEKDFDFVTPVSGGKPP